MGSPLLSMILSSFRSLWVLPESWRISRALINYMEMSSRSKWSSGSTELLVNSMYFSRVYLYLGITEKKYNLLSDISSYTINEPNSYCLGISPFSSSPYFFFWIFLNAINVFISFVKSVLYSKILTTIFLPFFYVTSVHLNTNELLPLWRSLPT